MSENIEREIGALSAQVKANTEQVKNFAEDVTKKLAAGQVVTDELKEKADKALVDMNASSARLTELEQKLARAGGGSGAPAQVQTLGHRVLANDDVKAMLAQGEAFKGRVRIPVHAIADGIETKAAITSASTSGASATTGLVVADRQPNIIGLPNRPAKVRDLIMPGRTVSSSIDYVKETVFTNNAAPVAENPATPKPQSDMQFALTNTPVRTIAHWVLASKQIMADAPMLQSYIDGRLRYGLDYAEDVQLLLGDGTGVNILGLMPQATLYAQPAGATVSAATSIDKLRLAMLQAALALFPATGHVLNPTDWANIELTKDGQGRYIFANPTGLAGPTLWGLPVAETLAMPQNNFLTGAFRYAAQIFDREDADVLISTEDRDNFVKNMVTVQ
jgi:HK97 family phage major capsid protein